MKLVENISKIEQWSRGHAVLVLLGLLGALITNSTFILGLLSLLSFVIYIIKNIRTLRSLHPFGGYANQVTTIRLLILLGLILFGIMVSNLYLVISLVVFVCLDGVDGWAARKFNQATVFGQYYDMELDALFVLFACFVLYMRGTAGVWILLPGSLRYIFVLYKWGIKNTKNEKRQRYAATIAGVFFVVLLISLGFQNTLQDIVLKLSSLSIIVSFGISFYQLHWS